jgi:23S rRNA maturation-related 3'-5' exoribonuclease YhaM
MLEMSEHALITHQNIGDSFSGVYYIEQLHIRETVAGKDFTELILRDKSGSRSVKYWGVVDELSKGDWAFVSCRVEEYMEAPSFIAKNLDKDEAPESLDNYITICEDHDKNVEKFEKLIGELGKLCELAEDQTPLTIVHSVFTDEFKEKFFNVPGGYGFYGCQGGALSRTVRVGMSVRFLSGNYKLSSLDKAISVAASLLHSIGSTEVFCIKDCMPDEATYGALLGTESYTNSRLLSVCNSLISGGEVTEDTAIRVIHAVVSYRETSVKAMTKEALLLAMANRIDEEVSNAISFIDDDVNENDDFTAYDPKSQRRYFKK